MKVIYRTYNRNSVEEMDMESQDAVRRAIEMVNGKRGFAYGGNRIYNCQLEVGMGHNIYTTTIEIRPIDSTIPECAYFCNGAFFEGCSRCHVELI